jgi:hypothetical protein
MDVTMHLWTPANPSTHPVDGVEGLWVPTALAGVSPWMIRDDKFDHAGIQSTFLSFSPSNPPV